MIKRSTNLTGNLYNNVWKKPFPKPKNFTIYSPQLRNSKQNTHVFARSPPSLPQTLFSRSLRSTIFDPGHPHPMRTLWITNGGPERVKKRNWREREEIVQPQDTHFFPSFSLFKRSMKKNPFNPLIVAVSKEFQSLINSIQNWAHLVPRNLH